jgi:hypothetical protein
MIVDYKLKVILTLLSAFVFSLIFIILAFAVPTHDKTAKWSPTVEPASKLGKISKSFRDYQDK